MTSGREALADNARRILLVLGVALVLLGGVGPGPVGTVSVLGIVVLLAGILLADPIASLLRSAGERSTADPIEALRERYVRGEIDHDEFERELDRALEGESGEPARDEPPREELTERSSK